MAATTTLASLLKDTAEELDLGLVIDAGTGATTTITETDTGVSELRGPFTGAKIPVGSPVTVITGGTVGEDTYVANFVSSTGIITLSPAITTGATGFIIWNPEIKHGKNVEKAISRAHQKCRRRSMLPLTFVQDGGMLGATIADYWTASAGTASYQVPTTHEFPRVVQISHSSAANVQSNTIATRAASIWAFETAIRATTDGDTATFTVQDIVNTAGVTVTYEVGDGSTTSREFQTQKGTFTVPGTADGDARIAFRLAVSGAGTMSAQMAPLHAYPIDAKTYPFDNRVLNAERIGNFYYVYGNGVNSGPDQRHFSEPITVGGREATLSDQGDHLTVTFNFQPSGPICYEELVYGGALTAMADTTTFTADRVKLWARAEIYDFLMRSEMRALKKLDNGMPVPSTWRALRNAAYKAAQWSNFEPEMANIVGRV